MSVMNQNIAPSYAESRGLLQCIICIQLYISTSICKHIRLNMWTVFWRILKKKCGMKGMCVWVCVKSCGNNIVARLDFTPIYRCVRMCFQKNLTVAFNYKRKWNEKLGFCVTTKSTVLCMQQKWMGPKKSCFSCIVLQVWNIMRLSI